VLVLAVAGGVGVGVGVGVGDGSGSAYILNNESSVEYNDHEVPELVENPESPVNVGEVESSLT